MIQQQRAPDLYKLDDGGRRDLSQSVLDRRDPFFFFLAYKVYREEELLLK